MKKNLFVFLTTILLIGVSAEGSLFSRMNNLAQKKLRPTIRKFSTLSELPWEWKKNTKIKNMALGIRGGSNGIVGAVILGGATYGLTNGDTSSAKIGAIMGGAAVGGFCAYVQGGPVGLTTAAGVALIIGYANTARIIYERSK